MNFFTEEKTILTVGKDYIKVAVVSLTNPAIINRVVHVPYTPDSLRDELMLIKRSYKTPVRILLSEELVTVFNLAIQPNELLNREVVSQRILAIAPELLQNTVWDFEQDGSQVNVVAINSSFFNLMQAALTDVGLSVEVVEPISYSLVRFTHEVSGPYIIAYANTVSLLVAIESGSVIASEFLSSEITALKIEKFAQQTKKHFGKEIATIITNRERTDAEELASKGYVLQVRPLEPMIGLAFKIVQKGSKNIVDFFVNNKTKVIKDFTGSKRWLVVFLCIASVIVVTWFMAPKLSLLFRASNHAIVVKEPKNTPTPSPTPKLEQRYAIKVLNGSGVEGAASVMQELLEGEGFKVVSTDNADSYDYVKTQIRTKSRVSTKFRTRLDSVLDNSYSVDTGEVLEDEEETVDVLVIVGAE